MGLSPERIFNVTVTLVHKTQKIRNSGIDRIHKNPKISKVTTKSYEALTEKSMKNIVNILRFFIKAIRHSLAWKLQYDNIK